MDSVVLSVPKGFECPDVYFKGTPEETAEILILGAFAHNAVRHEAEKSFHAQTLTRLKTSAEAEYQPIIQGLKEKLGTTITLIESLKARLAQTEESVRSVESRVREEERRNREEIVGELRAQLISATGSQKALVDGFGSLKESLLRATTSSVTKGRLGEAGFATLLLKAFGDEDCLIEEKGGEGHQGDIHMTWKQQKFMWETKNYIRTVQDSEVQKFLRDMEQNPDFRCGFMVSLQSGIAHHNKAGNIDLLELPDGRVCFFLTNFATQEDPVVILQSLRPFVELLLRRVPDDAESQTEEYALRRAETQKALVLKLLQGHAESMKRFRNALLNAKKKQEQLWLELTADMRGAEAHVKLMLETLLSDEEPQEDDNATLPVNEHVSESSSPTESRFAPTYLFKQTEGLTKAEELFIKQTLDTFSIQTDVKTSAKEIRDVYKRLGYSELALHGYRGLFADDVWPKGDRFVKYLTVSAESSGNV